MSETISIEPVFGHRYTIEVYEDDSKLAEKLKKLRDELGIKERDYTRVKIIENDIEWKGEKERLDMRKEHFDELIKEYQEFQPDT